MKSKAYFVKSLCVLKELDPESEEAKALYSLKIVDLLIEIKKYKPSIEEPLPPPPAVEEEEEKTLAQLLGCS